MREGPIRPARRSVLKAMAAGTAAVGAATGLSSCSSGTDDGKLYFWNGLVGDDGPYMQKIIDAYNATDPDFPVVFQPMNGNDLNTKIYSVLQTGKNIPDLVIQDQFGMATLQMQDTLNTMEEYIRLQPNLGEDAFLPTSWDAVLIDGKPYGIPLYLFSEVLYYNKDLIAEYGLESILEDGFVTIDDIRSMAGKLPEGMYALAQQNLPWAIMSLFYGAGGDLETGVKDMTAKPWRDAIQALKDLYDEGLMAPLDSDAEQLFGSGSCVFAIIGTWAQGNMKETLGEEKLGLTNALQFSAESPANFFYQSNWVQLKDENRSPERTAASAAFIEFVRENWMMWVETGSLSPNIDDIESAEYAEYLQSLYTRDETEMSYIRSSNYVYGGYATTGWGTFNDIIFGNVTMEEGLALLDQQTQAQIQIQEQSA